MKVAVWDTYVHRPDNTVMHFDIIAAVGLTDEEVVFGYGQEYLSAKQILTDRITTKECRFCYVGQATKEMIVQIKDKGYYILEMENCH